MLRSRHVAGPAWSGHLDWIDAMAVVDAGTARRAADALSEDPDGTS